MTDADEGRAQSAAHDDGPDSEAIHGELVEDADAASDGAASNGEGDTEEVDHPTRLLRIAGMIKGLLAEVETTDLDEAARDHLAGIHARSVEMLRDIVSDDLADELSAVTPDLGDGTPTGAELRVAQAQLAGWLEGLFHGIQASMASRQMAARQQKQLQGAASEGDGSPGSGQYL